MSEELLLSYILPCYNTEPFLSQCLESLYRQGIPESQFEVILVNNATEDNSEDIAFQFKKKYSNFRYIKLDKNICAGGAYNRGLESAQGKYIQFIDSDDYLKDSTLRHILTRMDDEDLEMLYFNIESFKNDGDLTFENTLSFNSNFTCAINCIDGNNFVKKAVRQMDILNIPVPAYRKMLKRSFLQDNEFRFTQTTIGCDYLHNQQLLAKAKRVAAIIEKPYMFRYNPNGVTKSKLNSTKIIYALNNYTSAFKKINEGNFDPEIAREISNNLKKVINRYISSTKYLDYPERLRVQVGIEDIKLVRNLSNGFVNLLLFNYPFIGKILLPSSLINLIKSFY